MYWEFFCYILRCGLSQLTLGQHCVADTVSGTTENVAEGGTEPHTKTTAASTAGRDRKRRHILTNAFYLKIYF